MLVATKTSFPDTPYKVLWIKPGFSVKVDPEEFPKFESQKWFAKKSFHCWYVVRWIRINGQRKLERMHRVVAETPPDMVTHHINFNPMDNRRANLMNVTEFEHAKMFSYR